MPVEAIFIGIEDDATIKDRLDGLQTGLHIFRPEFEVTRILRAPVFVEIYDNVYASENPHAFI